MYKILVVDDEVLIRKGLISKITYHGFDFEQILEGVNGREALQLIKEFQPNIVITDVRMPEMDGIELIRNAREAYPDTKFIIISGYAEFKYAEQALKMGVSGYILKPIVDNELYETLDKVIEDIDNMHLIHFVSSRREVLEKYCESISVEQKLNQVMHSTEVELNPAMETEFSNAIGYGGDDEFILGLIHIGNQANVEPGVRYTENELLKTKTLKLIDETDSMARKIVCKDYKDTNQIVVLLVHSDSKTLKLEADRYFALILDNIQMQLSVSVTIGISKIGERHISELYRQANESFQQRLIYGNGKIYCYDCLLESANVMLPKEDIRMLEKFIELSDAGNVEIILNKIFQVDNQKALSPANLKFLWIEIVNILIRVSNDLHPDRLSDFDAKLLDIDILNKFNRIDEIVSFLYTSIIDILKIDKAVDLSCKSKIKTILQYVEQHYQEELAVNDLAYMFAMSPNYFSTVFKKETGKTVINYITDVRIKNACKLLEDTKASVVDISNKVGYLDAQYFYRVFKKCTGKTPLEYRKNL